MKQADLTSKVRITDRLARCLILRVLPSLRKQRKIWGYSSAGRAPALQAGGLRFDPAYLHQKKRITNREKRIDKNILALRVVFSEMRLNRLKGEENLL